MIIDFHLDFSISARRAVVALILLAMVSGCGRPARIGPDRDALKAVDAFHTAVSLRDPALVADCRARLRALRDVGKLPDAAFTSLDAIADEARDGTWEPALDRLIRFMEGQ